MASKSFRYLCVLKEYSMLLENVFEYGKLPICIDFKTVLRCVVDYRVIWGMVLSHVALFLGSSSGVIHPDASALFLKVSQGFRFCESNPGCPVTQAKI
jgi:hypothetical protein